MLLQGVQWVAVSLPFVLIIGNVAAEHHHLAGAARTVCLQRTTLVTAVMLLSQAFLGHRLSLVSGPSAALLLGVTTAVAPPAAVYTSAALCGILLAVAAAAGLFRHLGRLFTPRVVAGVLLLIPFSMTPTIVHLVGSGNGAVLAFDGLLLVSLFSAHRLLPPLLRSLLVLLGTVGGTAAYYLLFGGGASPAARLFSSPFAGQLPGPAFDLGTLLSFFFCYLALAMNEIGSIRALEPLLRPSGMESRLRRGMMVTGGVNALAGILGVVGPVDYSLSPGVMAASGSASRFPLVPAGFCTLGLACSPLLLGFAAQIPAAVTGCILVFALSGQISAGMGAAFSGGRHTYDDGFVIGASLVCGTVAAWLPAETVAALPALARPLVANGFVAGVLVLLFLDLVFSGESPSDPQDATESGRS